MPAPLLYYSVARKELRSSMPSVPVLLSAASCTLPRGGNVTLRQPRLPPHITVRAADSGGFTAMTRWGGTYPFSPRQYVTWLMGWRPQWAALPDLGCLDLAAQIPPHSALIQARQRWTTDMARQMWNVYRTVPWAWVPTLHGCLPEHYAAHALAMQPLIEEMLAYYLEAATWDEPEEERLAQFRVGLGSLLPRSPAFVLATLEAVQQVLGRLLVRYHLWGKKLALLQKGFGLPGVISLDSSAWNGLFGPKHELRRASGLSEAHYSWQVSQPAYAQKVASALAAPQHIPLFSADQLTLSGKPITPSQPNVFSLALAQE